MRTVYLVLAMMILHSESSFAQKSIAEKEQELNNLLTVDDDTLFITSYVYRDIVQEKQRGVSGTEIKDGKNAASSATVDDKGITVNFSFNPVYKKLFIQPTISGKSDEGFVKLFSDNKYNSVLTGGINIQFFPATTGKYFRHEKIKTHNRLRAQRECFANDSSRLRLEIDSIVSITLSFYRNNEEMICNLANNNPVKQINYSCDSFKKYQQVDKNVDSLIVLGVLSKKFKEKSLSAQIIELDNIKPETITDVDIVKKSLTNNYIQKAEEIQKLAVWSMFRTHWIAGSIKYNISTYSVFDYTSKNYASDFNDEYVTASLSYNFLQDITERFQLYVSPTINFSSSRNFDKKSIVKLTTTSDYVLGVDTFRKTEKTFEFYDKIANRLYNVYFELPVIFYWPETNLGLDIAFRAGVNSPTDDNLGGRIGFLFPIAIKDEKAVIIEPMLRFEKLFSSASNDFIKDNMSFGFNINVSVPSFVSDGKKKKKD